MLHVETTANWLLIRDYASQKYLHRISRGSLECIVCVKIKLLFPLVEIIVGIFARANQ